MLLKHFAVIMHFFVFFILCSNPSLNDKVVSLVETLHCAITGYFLLKKLKEIRQYGPVIPVKVKNEAVRIHLLNNETDYHVLLSASGGDYF